MQLGGASWQQEIRFKVTGLKCPACCAKLKRQLMEENGIKACQVEFEKSEVSVQGLNLQEHRIIASIQQLGYATETISKFDAHQPELFETATCIDEH